MEISFYAVIRGSQQLPTLYSIASGVPFENKISDLKRGRVLIWSGEERFRFGP